MNGNAKTSINSVANKNSFANKLEFTTTEGNICIRINGHLITKSRYLIQNLLNRKLEIYEKVFFKKEKNNFLLTNLVLLNFKNKTQLHFRLPDANNPTVISYPTWSRNYLCCTECDTTKIKYAANGLCRNCYMKSYWRA